LLVFLKTTRLQTNSQENKLIFKNKQTTQTKCIYI